MDIEGLLPILFLIIYFVSMARKAGRERKRGRAGTQTGTSRPLPEARQRPAPAAQSEWERTLQEIREAMDEARQERAPQPLPIPSPSLPERRAEPGPATSERQPATLYRPERTAPVSLEHVSDAVVVRPESGGDVTIRDEKKGYFEMVPVAARSVKTPKTEPAPPSAPAQQHISALLKQPQSLRDALVLSEVLGAPRSRAHR